MPLTAEQITELKKSCNLVKKKPLRFFYCAAGEDDEPALLIGKNITNEAKALKKAAKKKKFVKGTVVRDGSRLQFVAETPPGKLAKDLKSYFGAKIPDLKQATVVGAEETAPADAPAPAPAPPPPPRRELRPLPPSSLDGEGPDEEFKGFPDRLVAALARIPELPKIRKGSEKLTETVRAFQAALRQTDRLMIDLTAESSGSSFHAVADQYSMLLDLLKGDAGNIALKQTVNRFLNARATAEEAVREALTEYGRYAGEVRNLGSNVRIALKEINIAQLSLASEENNLVIAHREAELARIDQVDSALESISDLIGKLKNPLDLLFSAAGAALDAHANVLKVEIAELKTSNQKIQVRIKHDELSIKLEHFGQAVTNLGNGISSLGSKWVSVEQKMREFQEFLDNPAQSAPGADRIGLDQLSQVEGRCRALYKKVSAAIRAHLQALGGGAWKNLESNLKLIQQVYPPRQTEHNEDQIKALDEMQGYLKRIQEFRDHHREALESRQELYAAEYAGLEKLAERVRARATI